MSDLAGVRATVHGRVQGVGFRDYVLARARALGLTGYVRNVRDFRAVEVVAEGPRSSLEQLLAHLRNGPRTARVDNVDVLWQDPSGVFQRFEITY